MAKAKEAYKVETFARKIGVTRQVLVNDDLGAFADLSRRMGQAAAETEAKTLVDLLEANSGNGPVMEDGDTLFHADHDNKAASGGAIADDTLSAARLAMRSQTGLSGQRISATTTASVGTDAVACSAFEPIRWSKRDTEETIRQAKEHNAAWKAVCLQRSVHRDSAGPSNRSP